ncbi:hypothetical protein SKAU_G00221610 [Synaphobranchus kaupii]|uniref:Uncharacterized protein n=1 Tax=Synaphobranchus kaupii TaxID=118154 RepID=A0A9Q1FAS2_SYNKA|nr:hypothetical protein SKAU_G00221610 [Synaphobranchus kaupii]
MDFPGFELIQKIIDFNPKAGDSPESVEEEEEAEIPPEGPLINPSTASRSLTKDNQDAVGLKRLLAGTQTALGTVQIMVGLVNIGLGAILLSANRGFLNWIGAPYWLGGVFIAAGLMSMLGERFPSPCLVFLTAFMNLASACLAVTAIVLYSVDLGSGQGLRWECNSYETATYRPERRRYRYRYNDYDDQTITPTPYDDRGVREFNRRTNFDICQSTRDVLLVLLGGIDILLIIFAVLQLCVTISATVLGVKALCKNRTEGKPEPDPELYKPLMEDVTTTNTV